MIFDVKSLEFSLADYGAVAREKSKLFESKKSFKIWHHFEISFLLVKSHVFKINHVKYFCKTVNSFLNIQ